tara:strand:+ start:249 stop:377 length:129 start_codon:yes stop_codon:yes gene_type:complete
VEQEHQLVGVKDNNLVHLHILQHQNQAVLVEVVEIREVVVLE